MSKSPIKIIEVNDRVFISLSDLIIFLLKCPDATPKQIVDALEKM